jgi:hypothetical protein
LAKAITDCACEGSSALTKPAAPGVEEADLLRLVLRHRRALGQAVDVDVAQGFAWAGVALAAGLDDVARGRWNETASGHGDRVVQAHIACHEVHRRIDERRAGGVVQRVPALQVQLAVRLVEHRHIVCAPGESGRQIAEIDQASAGVVGVHGDRQCGLGAQVLRDAVEDHPRGNPVVA